MKRLRIKIVSVMIMLGLILTFIACSNNHAIDEQKEPLIDFKALADLKDNTSDFNQVLLRLELLNVHSDILKFGINTPEEHQARINYYRVDFKQDVFLITLNDTVPCYDLHAERLYMDLPYMNFVLTFNHTLSSNDQLLINDRVYSNKALLVSIDQKIQPQ